MGKLNDILSPNIQEDRDFVGTVAFRNEQITLPDGSTIALGIDGAHWVLVYQKGKGTQFTVYDYDGNTKLFRVDKRAGNDEDLLAMRRLIKYFFTNARTEDLVTITPQRSTVE